MDGLTDRWEDREADGQKKQKKTRWAERQADSYI